jgi:hypothetical protein
MFKWFSKIFKKSKKGESKLPKEEDLKNVDNKELPEEEETTEKNREESPTPEEEKGQEPEEEKNEEDGEVPSEEDLKDPAPEEPAEDPAPEEKPESDPVNTVPPVQVESSNEVALQEEVTQLKGLVATLTTQVEEVRMLVIEQTRKPKEVQEGQNDGAPQYKKGFFDFD